MIKGLLSSFLLFMSTDSKLVLMFTRLVNSVLAEELKTIHAFSQKTLTPEQWAATTASPAPQ